MATNTDVLGKAAEQTGNPWPIIGVGAIVLGFIIWGVFNGSKHWDNDDDHH